LSKNALRKDDDFVEEIASVFFNMLQIGYLTTYSM
jgi:hypothetical protein